MVNLSNHARQFVILRSEAMKDRNVHKDWNADIAMICGDANADITMICRDANADITMKCRDANADITMKCRDANADITMKCRDAKYCVSTAGLSTRQRDAQDDGGESQG